MLVTDLAEDALTQLLVLDEFGVLGGQTEIRLRHDLRHVGDDGLEERPPLRVPAQLLEPLLVVTDPPLEGSTGAVPTRQHDAAQRPRHDPRDGAQIVDGVRCLA